MIIGVGSEPLARRGRSRRIVWGLALLIVAGVGSVLVLRITSLRGLPAIGEPFDTRKYAEIPIPDDENAYTFFRRATDRFVGQESDISGGSSSYTSWSQIPPETLRALQDNRESLDLWREGTERDRAVYIQPGSVTVETRLPVVQRLRSFSRLASLRAMRLRLDGDHAGAWEWIRANLRCGQLCGQNGFVIERLVGIAIYAAASAQAIRWADDPGVDAKLLRRALDDIVAAEAIATDYAQMIRHEYYSQINTIADAGMRVRILLSSADRPKWVESARSRLVSAYAILRHEPERSRRVLDLVTANWLSACDLPAEERARRAVQFGDLTLYRPAPGEAVAIPSEDLARWYETTLFAKLFFPNWKNIEAQRRRDEQARASLIMHIAENLYEKERGRPPSSPEELVGTYLKALPTGYIRIPDEPTAPRPPR